MTTSLTGTTNNTLTGGSLGGSNTLGSTPSLPGAAPIATAPTAKPKRRAGFFQYGHNQWGHITQSGAVNWNVKKAPGLNGGYRILNWNNVRKYLKATGGLSGMPTAAGKQHAWIAADPIYQSKTAEWIADRDQNINQFQRASADYKDEYNQGIAQIGQQFGSESSKMMASLAARGFGGSGVQSKSYGDLVRDRGQGEANLALKVGPAQWQRLADDAQKARELFSTRKLNETNMAKERYKAEHGKAPKGDKRGYWKKGSTWFFTNSAGVTVSIGKRGPKGKK